MRFITRKTVAILMIMGMLFCMIPITAFSAYETAVTSLEASIESTDSTGEGESTETDGAAEETTLSPEEETEVSGEEEVTETEEAPGAEEVTETDEASEADIGTEDDQTPFMVLSLEMFGVAVSVSDEDSLIKAIADNSEVTISINDDIYLTGLLIIPSGKTITLTGGKQLIGRVSATDDVDVISVGGTLILDGVTVTHADGYTGRGVFVEKGGKLTLKSGAISGNKLADLFANSPDPDGAGVYVDSEGAFDMLGGIISDNHAMCYGGGVFVNTDATFNLNSGKILDNIAHFLIVGFGGGVYNLGTFHMTDGVIKGNYAPRSGGGVNNLGTFHMTNSVITGNYTEVSGGGVYNEKVFTMNGGEISGNTAMGDHYYLGGGGLCNTTNATSVIKNATFLNNYAINGAGIHFKDHNANRIGYVHIEGSYISGNKARECGGGLLVEDGLLVITDTKITKNEAVWGGGLDVSIWTYFNDTDILFTITNSEISDNTADEGGGIHMYEKCYGVINIASDVIFNGNAADEAYDFGIENKDKYPNIEWLGEGSITGTHILNNYDIRYKGDEEITVHTVTFLGLEDSILKTEKVKAGVDANAPLFTNPEGWEFIDWDVNFSEVDKDTVVKALFAKLHKVEFVDWNGTLIKKEYVHPGNNATAPANPPRDGWEFIGWDVDFTKVEKDITVTAQYTKLHTVRFTDWNETVLMTEIVTHGSNATAPADPVRSGYTFDRWLGEFTNVTKDTTVKASYRPNGSGSSPAPAPEPGIEPDPEPEQGDEPDPENETEPGIEPELENEPEPGIEPKLEDEELLIKRGSGSSSGQGADSGQASGFDGELPPVSEGLLIQDGDIYIELDENGTPLGEWHLDEETGVWVFTPYPAHPLAFMPITGDNGAIIFNLLMFAFALIGFGLVLGFGRRYKH